MVTLIAMNIFNSLCVFGDTFTKQQHFISRCCTKALKIPLHRVMAAHACIDRPFMQSMGLHTRTQRMLGYPSIFSSNSGIEDHQVENEESQRPP